MIVDAPRQGIEQKFVELASEVVKKQGLELYDLDYFPGQGLLRLFIYDEKTDTAQLDDCVKVDHALTPFIEELDWMPEELTLEVSSPGVYRHLRSTHHFFMVKGKDITVVLNSKMKPEDQRFQVLKGQKKISGKLVSVSDMNIELEINGENIEFDFNELKKANLGDMG